MYKIIAIPTALAIFFIVIGMVEYEKGFKFNIFYFILRFTIT